MSGSYAVRHEVSLSGRESRHGLMSPVPLRTVAMLQLSQWLSVGAMVYGTKLRELAAVGNKAVLGFAPRLPGKY